MLLIAGGATQQPLPPRADHRTWLSIPATEQGLVQIQQDPCTSAAVSSVPTTSFPSGMLRILVPIRAAIASLRPPPPRKFSEVQLFQWSDSQWHPTDTSIGAGLPSGWAAGWDTLKQLCRWPWLCNAVSVTYWKIIVFVFLLVLLFFLSESNKLFSHFCGLIWLWLYENWYMEKKVLFVHVHLAQHSSAWEHLKDRTELLWCSLISPLVTGKTNADVLKSKRKLKPHHFYHMSCLETIFMRKNKQTKKHLQNVYK